MAETLDWEMILPQEGLEGGLSISNSILDDFLKSNNMQLSNMERIEPTLEFLEQPKQKGYRFRYASEGGSHGPIPGQSATKRLKKAPSVHIKNYQGRARVLVSLVTSSDPAEIHAHNLTGEMTEKGYALYEVSEKTNMVASLSKLSIEHVTSAKIISTLKDKLEQEDHFQRLNSEQKSSTFDVDEVLRSLPALSDLEDSQLYNIPLAEDQKRYRERAKALKENMDLGAVRLRIDAFLPSPDDAKRFTKRLPTIYSHTIYDQILFEIQKSTNGHAYADSFNDDLPSYSTVETHGELKIVKLSKTSGSVNGNEEVIMLCEKVTKDNIDIRFFPDGPGDTWEAFGSFSPGDVHKQYAITFQTPPYKDKGILKPVVVNVELRRKNEESDSSTPVKFTYQPLKHDMYRVGEKRKKVIPSDVDEILMQASSQPAAVPQPTTSQEGACSGTTINFDLLKALSTFQPDFNLASSTEYYTNNLFFTPTKES